MDSGVLDFGRVPRTDMWILEDLLILKQGFHELLMKKMCSTKNTEIDLFGAFVFYFGKNRSNNAYKTIKC